MILHAFHSEWLKRKRSFASTLIIGGSLFTPAVVAVRLIHWRSLPKLYAMNSFWPDMWRSCWESMAIFFLPLCAILATSLMTHLEFKSNGWKQLHALPLSPAVIFAAKLAVIIVTLVQFLALFTVGIYVSALIPSLFAPGVPHPNGSFFALPLLRQNALYFVDCLPILAAQYLMSLRSENVLIPIGAGFMAWVGALAAVSSKFAVWWPYSFTIIHYIKDKPKGAQFAAADANLHWLALGFFALFTLASYVLFITKRQKG